MAVEGRARSLKLTVALGLLETFLEPDHDNISPELGMALGTILRLGSAAATPSVISKLIELSIRRSWREPPLTEDGMTRFFLISVRVSLKQLRVTEVPSVLLDRLAQLMNDKSASMREAAVQTVGALGVAAARIRTVGETSYSY